jgi:acyl-CoA synthetase (AMP-forming)/AMP-acid ligase II
MVHDLELPVQQLASLREVWTGGAPCPEEVRAAFYARFGLALFQAYGLTEAPAVVTIEPLGSEHLRESSGVPLPHLDVDICDDDGKPVATGQAGEIVVHATRTGPWADAYTPMLGYWRNGEVNRLAEDVLRTGDIGVVDSVGNLYVQDRKSLLILRGGANVYPAEVERVLERFPGIRASAVLGLPDPRLGQRVVAAIEVDKGARVAPTEVMEHCRQNLARYKVPEEIVIVDTFARNAMGKVERKMLTRLFGHGHQPSP